MFIITFVIVFVLMLVSYITNARSNNQHKALKGDIPTSWRYVQKDKLVYRDTYVMVRDLYGKEG
jgi:hypothetical protein